MRGRSKVFYGWWVVAAASLGLFFGCGPIMVLSFGVFLKALTQDFHASSVTDIAMLVGTGGKERTAQEYRELLASSGFRLNRVISTALELTIIEAFPV